MKKTILGLMIGLSIANADLLNVSIEANEQMTWSEAKRYCATVDNLSSFTVPTAKFMESLTDKDKAILKNGRYWLDEVGDYNDAKAYGVYPRYSVEIISVNRDTKLNVICVRKNEVPK